MSLLEKVLKNKPLLKFESYYKFSFTFTGSLVLDTGEKIEIVASIGGDSDSIYGLSVSTSKLLELNYDNFNYINVKNLDTGETETFSDY